MLIIGWSLGIFLLGFVLHVVLWRIRKPRKSGKVLLLVFLGVAVGVLLAWWGASVAGLVPSSSGPDGIWANLHVLMVTFSMTAAYIASYPAVEANSPMPRIVRMVSDAGRRGLPRQQLYASLNRDILLASRMQDLVDSDLVVHVDTVYRPTANGRRLATLFIGFRRLLKAPRGG